jgi:predicted dehydrogenase
VEPIQVAIVGCGRISDLHALGYRGREDARLVAVCDAKRGRAREKAKAWGISPDKVYTDYQRLLADAEVDLVELLVPHHLHAEMTVQACRAGKHVSVQKPMALTAAEAEEMVAAADGAGVVLRVYENFCFYEPHVRARQMIESGEIGEPQMIRMHVGTGTSETQWKVPLSAWLWRLNEGKCGGGPLVFDHGYHLFSLARYLMGPVARVYAWLDSSPVGGVVPRFHPHPGDGDGFDLLLGRRPGGGYRRAGHPVHQPLHGADGGPAGSDDVPRRQDDGHSDGGD